MTVSTTQDAPAPIAPTRDDSLLFMREMLPSGFTRIISAPASGGLCRSCSGFLRDAMTNGVGVRRPIHLRTGKLGYAFCSPCCAAAEAKVYGERDG